MLLIALCVEQLKMHSSILFHRRANNYVLNLSGSLPHSLLLPLIVPRVVAPDQKTRMGEFRADYAGVYTENGVRWKIQDAAVSKIQSGVWNTPYSMCTLNENCTKRRKNMKRKATQRMKEKRECHAIR